MKLKNNELGKIRVLINRMRLKNQLEEVLENHTFLYIPQKKFEINGNAKF
jgi:hypothetical protein